MKRPFMTARRSAPWLSLALGIVLAGCEPEAEPPLSYDTSFPQHACGRLIPLLAIRSGHDHDGAHNKAIYLQAGERPLVFRAGLAIDADGAPNAYHPDDVSGLDALANARSDGQWVGIATDRNGRPFVQSGSDPAPGFYVSTTSLADPDIQDRANPDRYVDATRVPYIALPGGQRARDAYAGAGVRLGDIAIVYNVRTQRISPAVFADFAPSNSLGEGSIRLAEKLGYADTSPRHGGTSDAENLFVVFPGSGAGFPRDREHLEKTAYALLADWGAQERLDDCAAMLR